MLHGKSAQQVIGALQLAPHPEGGHYREVHRSACSVGVPTGFPGPRPALTAIYFLLQAGDFSAWHRVRGEEVWIHLAGAPLELAMLDSEPRVWPLAGVAAGGNPLHVVPPGVLQAARTRGDWSLLACLVAPGFEFRDFEMPSRQTLLARFPEWEEWILRYTR